MMTSFARHVHLPLALVAALAAAPAFAQTPSIEHARAALDHGDSDAAIATLEKAVEQYPQSARAHFYLGNAYLSKAQTGGMLAAASYAPKGKDQYEKAVALDPKYVDARFGLAQFYAFAPPFMGGSSDMALDQAKAIKDIDPILGHRAYAFIYSQQKKPDLARKEFVDAIREQPASPKAHGYFGQYLVNEKNYPAAFDEFGAALKADATYMPVFYHLGRAAAQADTNLARGEQALKKYLGYTPKENEPALAYAHYWLGAIYEKQGKKAEAKRSYEASLKLNPTLKEASEALKRVP